MAFFGSYYILKKMCKLENMSQEVLDGLTTSALLGTIIGARLGHCLFYQPDYYLSHPLEILMVWEGGLASHGGTIGILLAFYLYGRRKKIDYFWILSRCAVLVPLGAALIRVGNLMNSEIYGHTTSLPWGVFFVRSSEVLSGVEKLEPKHPTQVYEALFYLGVFAVLMWYYFREKNKQLLNREFMIGFLLASIFVFRFFIEFLKNDQVDFESNMAINMGQILSIPFVAIGGFFLFLAYKKKRLVLQGKFKIEG